MTAIIIPAQPHITAALQIWCRHSSVSAEVHNGTLRSFVDPKLMGDGDRLLWNVALSLMGFAPVGTSLFDLCLDLDDASQAALVAAVAALFGITEVAA